MDGTANAGRKGIAYLRDYYQPPATADAVATARTDDERTLVDLVGVTAVVRLVLSGS